MPVGAQFGHEVTEETRQKIRLALTGRKLVGPSPLVGRKQPPEVVRKRAEGQRKYQSDVCSVPDCGKPRTGKGLCSMHGWRLREHGDPQYQAPRASGPDHVRWKGDDITYDAAHWRARRTALADACASCGRSECRLEMALLHTANTISLRQSAQGPYSTNPADYVTLCVKCHRRYDSPRSDTRAEIELALTR